MLPFEDAEPTDTSIKIFASPRYTFWKQSHMVAGKQSWVVVPGIGPNVTGSVRNETKKDAMIREVTDYLDLLGSAHRSQILEHLTSKGIDLGKSPMPSLAAFLSDNRAIFASDGKGNFSLRSASQTLRDAEWGNDSESVHMLDDP
jgi:hypothetical protein